MELAPLATALVFDCCSDPFKSPHSLLFKYIIAYLRLLNQVLFGFLRLLALGVVLPPFFDLSNNQPITMGATHINNCLARGFLSKFAIDLNISPA